MIENSSYVVVMVTAKDADEARVIARGLLDEKLVACANIIDNIHSLFWWQEKIDEAKEVLLLLKTRKDLFDRAAKKIKLLHSYETPEIIAIPILAGSLDYLNWIDLSVRRK